MIESIGTTLKALISGAVTLYLAEAETGSYPYAVYDLTTRPRRTKDGVHDIPADLTITVYDKSYSQAKSTADSVESLIGDNLGSLTGQFVCRLLDRSRDCIEGVWSVQLNYYVRQNF